MHQSESDVRAYHDDGLVVGDMVTKREERAVFPQKSYPANHVHPVRPVPPVADVDIPKRSLQAPCPTVRMVSSTLGLSTVSSYLSCPPPPPPPPPPPSAPSTSSLVPLLVYLPSLLSCLAPPPPLPWSHSWSFYRLFLPV